MTAALQFEPPTARRRPHSPGRGVRRPRLVSLLAGADAPPLAVVVAPAGFGKTTLLREWSDRDRRPFAWITLNAAHNDSGTLLRSVAAAVDDATADAADGRIVLVLDEAHRLHSAAAHETLAALVTELPAAVSVALASRAELPLPIARLRAEGLVTEVRRRELAMTRSEATALLHAAGLQLGRDDVDALVHATEGWPAALSLAARTLRDHPVPGPAAARFGGGDRIMAEYLREEVIAALSTDERTFVRRTAILDVLCAPACDSVIGQPGSAAVIAGLARRGFPLVELDRTGERYRYHRLLRDLLRAELHRTEPEHEAELHRRASAWHAHAGDRDSGVRHALAADELGRAGDLVWAGVPSSIEQGSSATVEHHLNQFTTAQVAAHPRLALAAAATSLVHGHGDLAEHWLTAAATSPEPDISGAVAALRAALGRDGLERMAEDARTASALLDPASPCQALCGLLGGVADQLFGDAGQARARLDEAARRAAVTAPHVQALCLAQLALIALDERDWEEAARLSARARAQIARHGLDRYPTSALVLAVAALVRTQRGPVEEARADADAAAEWLERLTDLAPWHEIEVRIVLGRTALRLSDLNGARTLLAGAERLAARLPEAVTLRRWLDEAASDVEAFAAAAIRLPASLTTAELKILRFLPTHLSFREIAERTFVSANTVKTQANAVYRKLDVCSRSEAVALAHELGLLDPR